MTCLRVRFLFAALAICCLPHLAQAATPATWKENSYGYGAADVPLKKVLNDFARNFGVDLKLSGDFPEPVSGRIQGATASDFLDRLGTLQRFQWFVYNNVLYVSPNMDSVVERIDVNPETADQLKPALAGLGLFETKFGWGELGDGTAVTIAGPVEYVRLVRQLIQRKEELRRDDYEAMVFRLKYAAVDDRKITVRDQVVNTPGVATMLRNMITSAVRDNRRTKTQSLFPLADVLNPGPAPVPGQLNSAVQTPLSPLSTFLQAPPVPVPGEPSAAARQMDQSALATSAVGPTVIGDIRTNSIIIFDLPRKREYYQRLVNALDVQQRLVEIEAYIVDVNRERLSEFGADFSIGGNKNLSIGNVATLASGALVNTTVMAQHLGKFLIRLQMLEGKGDARTLAKPSVLTLENLTAVLDMSQTVYLKATGERVANITPVTAGTLLRVTPRTIEENGQVRVHLTVDIEDGAIGAIPNSDMPEVQKSTISTQTILENQESLVIGGYDVDSSGNRLSGIPGLSRVPFVGSLFSTSSASSQSRQRLFILTPRIVKTGAERDRAEAALATEQVVTLAATVTGSRLRLSNQLGAMLRAEQAQAEARAQAEAQAATISPPNFLPIPSFNLPGVTAPAPALPPVTQTAPVQPPLPAVPGVPPAPVLNTPLPNAVPEPPAPAVPPVPARVGPVLDLDPRTP